MTAIDRISPTGLPPTLGAAQPDARSAASAALGELGHRVLAWVGAVGPSADAGRAAWSGVTGAESGFRPDSGELARGGDVYDLRGLASGISDQLGGTPTQEGTLRRALEDFTRQAVVQVAGLAGAAGDRQVEGLRQALEVAGSATAGSGVDGVIERLDAATATLARQNGN